MSTEGILLIVVALIPLVGNLAALVLRRYGKNSAADWVVRMTPLAVVAASSKSREEAIARLTEEVMKLTGPDSIPAQVVARDVLTKSVPPPPSAAGVLPLGLLVLALYSSGCTPVTSGGSGSVDASKIDVPEVVGGACSIAELVAGVFGKGSDQVKVVCKVLQGGTGALANMSTGPSGVEARPPSYATVEFVMPRDQAEKFVARNGGAVAEGK